MTFLSIDSDEARQRAAVIAEARAWVGTPWRHQSDIKGQAVDCAMLLVRSFVDTGVIAPFDPRPYPRTWFMHQDREWFLEWVIDNLGGVEITDPVPGDVLVYRFGRCFSHGVLLVEPKLVVHAFYKNRRCITTETFDAELAKRPVKAFDMWAKRRS